MNRPLVRVGAIACGSIGIYNLMRGAHQEALGSVLAFAIVVIVDLIIDLWTGKDKL